MNPSRLAIRAVAVVYALTLSLAVGLLAQAGPRPWLNSVQPGHTSRISWIEPRDLMVALRWMMPARGVARPCYIAAMLIAFYMIGSALGSISPLLSGSATGDRPRRWRRIARGALWPGAAIDRDRVVGGLLEALLRQDSPPSIARAAAARIEPALQPAILETGPVYLKRRLAGIPDIVLAAPVAAGGSGEARTAADLVLKPAAIKELRDVVRLRAH